MLRMPQLRIENTPPTPSLYANHQTDDRFKLPSQRAFGSVLRPRHLVSNGFTQACCGTGDERQGEVHR